MYTSWNNYSTGSGGRISSNASDLTPYTGSYIARSGSYYKIAGAGTVYMKSDTEEYGHLIVNNGGYESLEGSTPIRNVGLHLITDVQQVDHGVWHISVDGTPWRSTDTRLDWGVQNIEVDLDASENLSALYRIESNTENGLIIHSLDDLSDVLGNQLMGVHTFTTLNISAGAKVSAGSDKIIIIDKVNSVVEPLSALQAGAVFGL